MTEILAAGTRAGSPADVRVGVDVGGTKTDAVAVDSAGAVLGELRLPTGFGADKVLESTADAVSLLTDRIGVAPGAYSLLGARNGGPGASSMAYLNLGTGLAAGLVLGGELWRGSRGSAGEIGHIPVDPAGPQCLCGQRGCLETVASGSAVARQWPTDAPRPVQALFEAARAGDASAVTLRDRLVANIAAAVRLLVLTVDVDLVVIGGGISSMGEQLLGAVRGELATGGAVSPFLASLDLPGRVQLVPAGFPAAAVGAALVGAHPKGAA